MSVSSSIMSESTALSNQSSSAQDLDLIYRRSSDCKKTYALTFEGCIQNRVNAQIRIGLHIRTIKGQMDEQDAERISRILQASMTALDKLAGSLLMNQRSYAEKILTRYKTQNHGRDSIKFDGVADQIRVNVLLSMYISFIKNEQPISDEETLAALQRALKESSLVLAIQTEKHAERLLSISGLSLPPSQTVSIPSAESALVKRQGGQLTRTSTMPVRQFREIQQTRKVEEEDAAKKKTSLVSRLFRSGAAEKTKELTLQEISLFLSDAYAALEQEPNISTVGIYRVSAEQDKLMLAMESFAQGNSFLDIQINSNPILISSLIKKIFRDSCTLFSYEDVKRIDSDSELENAVKIKQIYQTARPELQVIFKKMLTHLYVVIANEEKNKMSAANLAVCMGPNLWKIPKEDLSKSLRPNELLEACLVECGKHGIEWLDRQP